MTITTTSLKMFQYNIYFEILFKGVIFISNWCNISNNIKASVKQQPSVKNEAIESQWIDNANYVVTSSLSVMFKWRSET